jgi:hypothetical protein
VRNRFARGDRPEIIHPSGNRNFPVQQMQSLKRKAQEIAPQKRLYHALAHSGGSTGRFSHAIWTLDPEDPPDGVLPDFHPTWRS